MLTLGPMAFGAEIDEATAHGQQDHFVDDGGNLVNIVEVHGHVIAERVIGRWFDERPGDRRDRVAFATKGRFANEAVPNEDRSGGGHAQP
jgi:aryl-alcohol dehydrogenase-like predicted oxidoreductase